MNKYKIFHILASEIQNSIFSLLFICFIYEIIFTFYGSRHVKYCLGTSANLC
jgi:hypothetical protein